MSNVDDLERQAQNLRDIIKRLESKQSELESENKDIDKSLSSLKKEKKRVESEVENLQNTHKRLSSEYSSVQKDISSVKKELITLKSTRDQNFRELEEIQIKKKETQDYIDSLKSNENAFIEYKRDRLKEIDEALAKEKEDMEKNVRLSTRQLDEISRTIKGQKDHIQSMINEAQFYNNVLAEKSVEVKEKLEEIRQKEKEISTLVRSVKDHEEVRRKVREDIDKEKERFDAVNQDVHLAIIERDKVKKELEEVRSKLLDEKKKIDDLHRIEREVARREGFIQTKYNELGIPYE